MRRREGIVRFFQSRLANTLSSFTLPSFEELPLAGLRDEARGKRSKRARHFAQRIFYRAASSRFSLSVHATSIHATFRTLTTIAGKRLSRNTI